MAKVKALDMVVMQVATMETKVVIKVGTTIQTKVTARDLAKEAVVVDSPVCLTHLWEVPAVDLVVHQMATMDQIKAVMAAKVDTEAKVDTKAKEDMVVIMVVAMAVQVVQVAQVALLLKALVAKVGLKALVAMVTEEDIDLQVVKHLYVTEKRENIYSQVIRNNIEVVVVLSFPRFELEE